MTKQIMNCLCLTGIATILFAPCSSCSTTVHDQSIGGDAGSDSRTLDVDYCGPYGKNGMHRVEMDSKSYIFPADWDSFKQDVVSKSPDSVYLSVHRNAPDGSEKHIRAMSAFLSEIRSAFFVGIHRSSGIIYVKYGELFPSNIRLKAETENGMEDNE